MSSARPVFKLVSVTLAAWLVGCTDPTGSRSTAKPTRVASARSTSTVTVTSTNPSAAPTDTTLDVQVIGSGFDNGSIASFLLSGVVDPRVRVNSTRFVKSTQLVANLTIAVDAVAGLYDVAVATRSGPKGIGTELFAIKGRLIALSPTSVNFSSTQGVNPDPQKVNVSNAGIGKVSGLAVGTITYGSGQPTGWLAASLSATSAPTTLTVTATSGSLATGTYTATVPVTSSVANNSPQTVSVTFTPNLPAFSAVDMGVGGDQTCGLSPANGWYCWGHNSEGGVGDGTTTARLTPVAVTGGTNFVTVSSGGLGFVCGLTAIGAAYCWGNNWYGQLGDGTTTNRYVPVTVTGGLTFVTLTAGLNHTCGLTADGLAYCWGRNSNGQLGVGTDTTRHLTPVAVSGGIGFASVRAMSLHTCGVTSAGAAYCWGANDVGQLGDGTQTRRYTPVAVKGGLTFAALGMADGNHTCGVTASGGVAYCWGYNSSGELGDGTTTQRLTPVAVAGGLHFVGVSAGDGFTCGLTDAGAAYCWGHNSMGSLGDGTFTQRLTPVPVTGGLTFTALGTAFGNACGLAASIMYCWGGGGNYLGDGTTNYRSSPTPVRAP